MAFRSHLRGPVPHPGPGKIAALIALFLSAIPAAHGAINIDTVFVGDPGNADDSTGFGGIPYAFEIGRYEVTNAQYAGFLNAVAVTDTHGLYHTSMAGEFGGIARNGTVDLYSYTATRPDRPVNFVSFYDAARFANWLTNGQPIGAQDASTTEDGMYDLGSGAASRLRDFAAGDAGWAIPSEAEWYKAAFYDPSLNAGSGGYWDYPTQSDTAPTGTVPNDTDPNSANLDFSVGNPVDVGSYVLAASAFGTFDQGGNVSEWNDSILSGQRSNRGGTYNGDDSFLASSTRATAHPSSELPEIGFRVVTLTTIPEPSTHVALLGSLALGWVFLRRTRR